MPLKSTFLTAGRLLPQNFGQCGKSESGFIYCREWAEVRCDANGKLRCSGRLSLDCFSRLWWRDCFICCTKRAFTEALNGGSSLLMRRAGPTCWGQIALPLQMRPMETGCLGSYRGLDGEGGGFQMDGVDEALIGELEFGDRREAEEGKRHEGSCKRAAHFARGGV
jgi:hypothetical protein